MWNFFLELCDAVGQVESLRINASVLCQVRQSKDKKECGSKRNKIAFGETPP